MLEKERGSMESEELAALERLLTQTPYVHTREGAVEKVLETSRIMREDGRERLMVGQKKL